MDEQKRLTLDHFKERSGGYNESSVWVTDRRLLEAMVRLARPKKTDVVLDLATGTGLVARQFRPHAGRVIGLDISVEMTKRARPHLDELKIGRIEDMPIADQSVDICTCRQGLQFVDLLAMAREVKRVLKPGGRLVFCHLNAYGAEDRADTFAIQRLRNPARLNFFGPGDLEKILIAVGLQVTRVSRHLSREPVNKWIEHGANTAGERKQIIRLYQETSSEFQRLHRLEFTSTDVFDTMLFLTIVAEKPC